MKKKILSWLLLVIIVVTTPLVQYQKAQATAVAGGVVVAGEVIMDIIGVLMLCSAGYSIAEISDDGKTLNERGQELLDMAFGTGEARKRCEEESIKAMGFQVIDGGKSSNGGNQYRLPEDWAKKIGNALSGTLVGKAYQKIKEILGDKKVVEECTGKQLVASGVVFRDYCPAGSYTHSCPVDEGKYRTVYENMYAGVGRVGAFWDEWNRLNVLAEGGVTDIQYCTACDAGNTSWNELRKTYGCRDRNISIMCYVFDGEEDAEDYVKHRKELSELSYTKPNGERIKQTHVAFTGKEPVKNVPANPTLQDVIKLIGDKGIEYVVGDPVPYVAPKPVPGDEISPVPGQQPDIEMKPLPGGQPGEEIEPWPGQKPGTNPVPGDSTVEDINPEDYKVPLEIIHKFPFCVPWDVVNVLRSVQVTAVAPKFDIPVEIPSIHYSTRIVVDMEKFEVLAKICRAFAVLLYIMGLAMLTRNIIRG